MTADTPILETDRLILRRPREDDYLPEVAFYQTEASKFVGGPKPAHQVWRSMAMLAGHWQFRGYGFWAVEEKATGIYQGRVGPWLPLGWKEREIGWTLMPSATGKGYATEAAIAARTHAYDVLGWDTAISQIDPRNEPSKAVARRLGATYESVYEDPEYGPIEIWRHPSAADLKGEV